MLENTNDVDHKHREHNFVDVILTSRNDRRAVAMPGGRKLTSMAYRCCKAAAVMHSCTANACTRSTSASSPSGAAAHAACTALTPAGRRPDWGSNPFFFFFNCSCPIASCRGAVVLAMLQPPSMSSCSRGHAAVIACKSPQSSHRVPP